MSKAMRLCAGFKDAWSRFAASEDGATAIEYSLIVSLIFLAIMGAVKSFVDTTSGMYSEISSAMS
jgi:pilus assembly protein Flp/PilA